MEFKYSSNWKKILIIWIAIGISISGYFYIFPNIVRVQRKGLYAKELERVGGPLYEKSPVDKVTMLVTVVGAILIGGFGKLSNNKDN